MICFKKQEALSEWTGPFKVSFFASFFLFKEKRKDLYTSHWSFSRASSLE